MNKDDKTTILNDNDETKISIDDDETSLLTMTTNKSFITSITEESSFLIFRRWPSRKFTSSTTHQSFRYQSFNLWCQNVIDI